MKTGWVISCDNKFIKIVDDKSINLKDKQWYLPRFATY
jgi:hypothetical protein